MSPKHKLQRLTLENNDENNSSCSVDNWSLSAAISPLSEENISPHENTTACVGAQSTMSASEVATAQSPTMADFRLATFR